MNNTIDTVCYDCEMLYHESMYCAALHFMLLNSHYKLAI